MHSIYHRSACGAVQGNNTYKKTRQQTIMRRILEDRKRGSPTPCAICAGEEHLFQTHSGDQHTVVKSKALTDKTTTAPLHEACNSESKRETERERGLLAGRCGLARASQHSELCTREQREGVHSPCFALQKCSSSALLVEALPLLLRREARKQPRLPKHCQAQRVLHDFSRSLSGRSAEAAYKAQAGFDYTEGILRLQEMTTV